jgi:hypothetical protein
MSHEEPIRILLPEKDALARLLQVKPTDDMTGKRRKKSKKSPK